MFKKKYKELKILFNQQYIKFKEIPTKYSKEIKEAIKNGSETFVLYNYSILLVSFVLMYITIHLYFYLNGLTHSYEVIKMGYDMTVYNSFLEDILTFGTYGSLTLAIIYVYVLLMFMFNVSQNEDKEIAIDPLLINFAYFFTLISSLYYKGYDHDTIIYFSFFIPIPILIYIFIRINKEIKLNVSSKVKVSIKVFLILFITYTTEHIEDIAFSTTIIKNDIKNKYKKKANKLLESEKKKILNQINNDRSIIISDIYTEGKNTTHIVIKNLQI